MLAFATAVAVAVVAAAAVVVVMVAGVAAAAAAVVAAAVVAAAAASAVVAAVTTAAAASTVAVREGIQLSWARQWTMPCAHPFQSRKLRPEERTPAPLQPARACPQLAIYSWVLCLET